MDDFSAIAGIVLAGGRSSRMGRDKALLPYNGKPLVQHMIGILQETGIRDIFVSGSLPGYPCIADESAYAGPARAIMGAVRQKPGYHGYLFVPVDMPLLPPLALIQLLRHGEGAFFMGNPLPAYITPPFVASTAKSVQGLLEDHGIYPIDIPPLTDDIMKNVNTPQEWQEVAGSP